MNLKPSVQNHQVSRPIGPQQQYVKAGYAPVFVGGVRGIAPAISPALNAPEAQARGTTNEDPNRQTQNRTQLRFDQFYSAHQNSLLVWQTAHSVYRQFDTTAPARWPGQPALLPRLFAPGLGALGGNAQRGFHQDQSRSNGLYHLNPRWALRVLASARTVSQTLNRGQNSVGIPGVFVPTSPGNFYAGRGTN